MRTSSFFGSLRKQIPHIGNQIEGFPYDTVKYYHSSAAAKGWTNLSQLKLCTKREISKLLCVFWVLWRPGTRWLGSYNILQDPTISWGISRGVKLFLTRKVLIKIFCYIAACENTAKILLRVAWDQEVTQKPFTPENDQVQFSLSVSHRRQS